MKKEISVSVIIPAYNSEKYLGACLESVLRQDFENFEVIVVDNNSSDSTKEIILELAQKHKNLKYFFEPKIGRGAARNTGEKQAVGKVILMTDSDCVVPKGWIRAMVELILSGSAPTVQGGEIALGQDFWSRQTDLRSRERIARYESGQESVKVDTKNFAISGEILGKIGFTDRRYVSGNDTDLYIRLLKENVTPISLGTVCVRHHHPNSLFKIARKQFVRAFWSRRITKDNLFFLRQTNFLTETGQKGRPLSDSIKNLKATICDKGVGYTFFNLVVLFFWRLGLYYSDYRPWNDLPSLDVGGLTETISVIIPMRDRYDFRVRNCLKSLRNQNYKRDLVKIVLIDFGSEDKYRKNFDDLCRTFDATGIWTGRSDEIWNKSKCLNLALQQIETKYILVADVDVVFARNYLETCVRLSRAETGKSAFYPRMFDCPKGLVTDKSDVVGDFNKIVKKTVYRGELYRSNFPYGVGILFTEKVFLTEIGGFDEYYAGWGSEDTDMVKRLSLAGISVVEINDQSSIFHQWHPKFEGSKNDTDLDKRILANRRYCQNNFSLVRNQQATPPQFPKKLSGSLWGVTCIFNPVGYRSKYDNYQIFRKSLKKQGVKLLVVELALNGEDFCLGSGDAEILVQIRGDENNVMWQKEALLNIALKKLPVDCDKVVWLDSDIIFANDDWAKATGELLEKYNVVQPYQYAVRLPPNVGWVTDSDSLGIGSETRRKNPSFAFAFSEKKNAMIAGEWTVYATGYVCAIRRSILEKINFYDLAILGSADALMLKAFGGWSHFSDSVGWSHELIRRHNEWLESAYREVGGSIYYTEGAVFHLWHGNRSERGYQTRDKILKLNNFNPTADIRKNPDGIFEWTTDKEQLKRQVRDYFISRNEDGVIDYDSLASAPDLVATYPKSRSGFGKNLGKRLRHLRLVFGRAVRRRLRKITSWNFNAKYSRFLGKVGERIRVRNQDLYFRLKKYFPDRN